MKAKYTIMAILFFIVSNVYAQQTDDKIESLRGLKGIRVIVEDLKPDIEKDGLREDSIRTDVELKLRLAGIKVLTNEERLNEPGSPYLYVNVSSMKSESYFYAFSLGVMLNQRVFLARNPDIVVYGVTTWDTRVTGFVGEKNVDRIRDSVKDLVDKFINDYLSVNPK